MDVTNLKLEASSSWRRADYLCELYPELTAKEIIILRDHEKKCFELWEVEQVQEQHDKVKEINDAGALYYKGRFGVDQRYYYKIYDAQVMGKEVYATIEKIVVFLGCEGSVISEGRLTMEKKVNELTKLTDYHLSLEHVTTEAQWNELNEYLQNVAQFWHDIKMV